MGHPGVFSDIPRSDSTGLEVLVSLQGEGPTTGSGLQYYQELQKPVETQTREGKAQP